MSYSKENYIKVKEEFTKKRTAAREFAENNKAEIRRKHPDIDKIEEELSKTGTKIFAQALLGKDGLDERIAELREENDKLIEKRDALLQKYGYDPDLVRIKYDCDKCNDTGVFKGVMCSCMKKAIAMAGYESAGILMLMGKQSFESFSLEYYKDKEENYRNMQAIFKKVKKYVKDFSEKKLNETSGLFFFGGTGLGKTHLSASIASSVVDAGFDVVYQSSSNMFSDFKHDEFQKSYSDTENRSDKYFSCDLLIIDDLGVELVNQFTVSCLYNIINTRIIKNKQTIINTNLSQSELEGKYGVRIVSRLFGEFEVCMFQGQDIRMQKLQIK